MTNESTDGRKSAPTRIRGVIWDVDGTMADTIPMILGALRDTFVAFGAAEYGLSEIEAMFGPTEEGVLLAVLGDDIDAAYAMFLAEYAERHEAEVMEFPGVRDVVLDLARRGISQAVVTGKGPHSAAITLDHLGYGDVFDFVATGSVEGQVKAKQIAAIVSDWAMTPTEVVYIGDHPKDVEDAHAAGVLALVAAWKPDADTSWVKDLQPDGLFDTTEALTDWMDAAIRGMEPPLDPP